MSVAFASARPRGKGEVTQQTIQKMLDENHHLIQCILDHQSKGKTAECAQYQQILHRNLVYLATIADSNQNMQSLLPAPPTQNMNLGPGALSQSGASQGLHSQGSLSDAISTGLPPASLMQGQIGNGPNHVTLQQTAQSTLPTTSMSMSGSGHGSGPGYSHSGPSSQSVPLQGQGAISNYVSRANINMQSNPVSMMHQQAASSHYNSAQGGSQHYQGQPIAMMGQSGQGSSMMGQRPMAPYRPSQQGSSQQYLGQEEYYGGEQYGHSQAASERSASSTTLTGTAIMPISSHPTRNRAMTGPSRSPRSTTMRAGTRSTASSRRGTSRAQPSSRRGTSSSTPTSRATRASSRATGRPREPPRSIPATSKDKANSTGATGRHRPARPRSSSGRTATSRASMEITSSKGQRSWWSLVVCPPAWTNLWRF